MLRGRQISALAPLMGGALERGVDQKVKEAGEDGGEGVGSETGI